MKRLFTLLPVVLFLAAPQMAEAEDKAQSATVQRDEQLDALFGRLRSGKGAELPDIEAKIWEVWSRPVSPTAEVLLQQASSAMADRDYDTAEKILGELTSTYPDFSEGWNRRATMYFVEQKYDLSLKDIEKVLELEPRHFGALAGRGMIYQRQEKWGLALDAFREALRINPNMQGVKDAIKAIEKTEREI